MALSVPELWKSLTELGMADAGTLRQWATECATAHGGRFPSEVEALAGWLVQQSRLSQYQAATILAGESFELRRGPWLVVEPSAPEPFSRWFVGREVGSSTTEFVYGVAEADQMNPEQRFRVERHAAVQSTLLMPLQWRIDSQGVGWLSTRLDAGELLSQRIAEQPLDSRTCVKLSQQLALAIQSLHDQKLLVHGIRPDRVWLGAAGQTILLRDPFVIPFNPLSEAMPPSALDDLCPHASLQSAAPEFSLPGVENHPVTEVYALGCLLYEARFGKPAFPVTDTRSAADAHNLQWPERLDKKPRDGLQKLIAHCLSKNVAARFGSATAVAQAAQFLLTNPQLLAVQPTSVGSNTSVSGKANVGDKASLSSLGMATEKAAAAPPAVPEPQPTVAEERDPRRERAENPVQAVAPKPVVEKKPEPKPAPAKPTATKPVSAKPAAAPPVAAAEANQPGTSNKVRDTDPVTAKPVVAKPEEVKPVPAKPAAAPNRPAVTAEPKVELKAEPVAPAAAKAVEEAAEKTSEKVAEKRSEKPVEKPAEPAPAPVAPTPAAPVVAKPAAVTASPAKAPPPAANPAAVAAQMPVSPVPAPPVPPAQAAPPTQAVPPVQLASPQAISPTAGKKRSGKKKKKKKQNYAPVLLGAAGFAAMMVIIALLAGNQTRKAQELADQEEPAVYVPPPQVTTQGTTNTPGTTTVASSSQQSTGPELVNDPNLLWAAPAAKDPVPLKMVPAGTQTVLLLRPARLLATPTGRQLLESFDPDLSTAFTALQTRTGVAAGEIDRLFVAFEEGPSSRAIVSLAVFLQQPKPLADLKAKWGEVSEAQTPEQVVIFASDKPDGDAFYVAEQPPSDAAMISAFTVGSVASIKRVAEVQGDVVPLPRAAEQLWAQVNDAHDLALMVNPNLLFAGGRSLLENNMPRMIDPLKALLVPDVSAGLITMQFSPQWYAEVRITPGGGANMTAVVQRMRATIDGLPDVAEQFLLNSTPHSSWRGLANRMPQMLRAVAANTRVRPADSQAIANMYLPTPAAPNVLLSSWLAAHTPAGEATASATVATASPKKPLKFAEILDAPVNVGIVEEDMHAAAGLIAEIANSSAPEGSEKVVIKLMGNDLQKDGITQNQKLRDFNQKGVPLRQVLTALCMKAHTPTLKDPKDPLQKLVWAIGPNPDNPQEKAVLITTRTGATAFELAPEFVTPKP